MNLIENGIKYNREQGLVKVWAASDGNVLRITVSDSGMGIEEKHQERIFDRFYRIDEDRNSRHGRQRHRPLHRQQRGGADAGQNPGGEPPGGGIRI